MLDAVHDDEQPDEEEDRHPLDFAEPPVDVLRLRFGAAPEVRDQQQEGRSDHRDRGGLQSQGMGEHEGDDHESEHREGLLQQPYVGDRLALLEAHDVRTAFVAGPHPAAVDEVEHRQCRGQDERRDRGEVEQEVIEGEPHRGTDHDVGRIADQGRGASDVRREDLRDQERIGADVQFVGDEKRHRCDQEDGGHVVEQRREHGGDHREHHHNRPGTCQHPLGRPDRDELEHPAAPRDRDDDHHSREQPEGVEIHAPNCGLLVQDAERNHQAGADQRHDRAVDAFADDDRVGEDEEDARDPDRVPSEDDVAGGVSVRVHASSLLDRIERASGWHAGPGGVAGRLAVGAPCPVSRAPVGSRRVESSIPVRTGGLISISNVSSLIQSVSDCGRACVSRVRVGTLAVRSRMRAHPIDRMSPASMYSRIPVAHGCTPERTESAEPSARQADCAA